MNNKRNNKQILPLLLFAIVVISLISCNSIKNLSSYQIKSHSFMNDVLATERYSLNLDIIPLDTIQSSLIKEYFVNNASFTQRMTERNNFTLEYIYSCIKTQLDSLETHKLYNKKWKKKLIKHKPKSVNKHTRFSYPFFIRNKNIAVILVFYPTPSDKLTKDKTIYTTVVAWWFYKYEKNHWTKIGALQISDII